LPAVRESNGLVAAHGAGKQSANILIQQRSRFLHSPMI
jgi:hypothetical protein